MNSTVGLEVGRTKAAAGSDTRPPSTHTGHRERPVRPVRQSGVRTEAPGTGQALATVLLVDDEPDILESYQRLLAAKFPALRIITAASPAEALAAFAGVEVDLIISDFRMPAMDGLQFLARAEAVWPHAGRVLVTAYPDEGLRQRATTEARVELLWPKSGDIGAFLSWLGTRLGM